LVRQRAPQLRFGKLRGVIGNSYLYARTYSGLGSGLSTALASIYSKGGKEQSKTTGAYFCDFTDGLALSAEGRYQVDELASYVSSSGLTVPADVFVPAGNYAPGMLLANETFRNFTPRMILNYQVSPELMLYASWAKGINPAQFSRNP